MTPVMSPCWAQQLPAVLLPARSALTRNYSGREEAKLHFIFLVNASSSPQAEG